MTNLQRLTIALVSSVAVIGWAQWSAAADLMLSPEPIAEQDLPMAVSAVNGKWELDLGMLNSTGAFRAAGSLSIPIGTQFGLQGDVMATTSGSTGTVFAAALHGFTRDPSSYLLGVTSGVVVASGAQLAAVGIEGELYIDRISLEGWAGLAAINYVSPPPSDTTGAFAFGDLAYYPSDDWRVALGGSYVLGQTAFHVGTEYLFHDLGTPLSLTADARVGSGNFVATIGLKGYFGGNDDGKSLIDRQRQDDPRNRAVDLFNAASDIIVDNDNPVTGPEQYNNNEQACFDAGYQYQGTEGEGGFCYDPEATT